MNDDTINTGIDHLLEIIGNIKHLQVRGLGNYVELELIALVDEAKALLQQASANMSEIPNLNTEPATSCDFKRYSNIGGAAS